MGPDVISAIVAALTGSDDVMPTFTVQDGPFLNIGQTDRGVVYLRHVTGAVYRVEVTKSSA